ncbi:hypothetical protein ACFQS7_21780 [Dankookia sp. GCM10030260]|uniref:hypothetical protein n=1 Tax=Dankookia sp. GCM10030260 TaxID=3273390 RepID=UPI00361486B6
MPVYLNAGEVGTARDLLGFPQAPRSLGVVAMTAGALFGVNLDAEAPDTAVATLRDFMATRQAGPILALYGSCNHAGRYADAANRLAAWQAEMQGVAGLLGAWHGPARGCNTGFIEPREGTTIEYSPDYGAGACDIHYRRASAGQGQLHAIDSETRLLAFEV